MPGVITAAPTIKQARIGIRDALAEYLTSFEPAPDETSSQVEILELAITN